MKEFRNVLSDGFSHGLQQKQPTLARNITTAVEPFDPRRNIFPVLQFHSIFLAIYLRRRAKPVLPKTTIALAAKISKNNCKPTGVAQKVTLT
jgi:hypothetical protein